VPVISPSNANATLSKMARALRDKPENWETPADDPGDDGTARRVHHSRSQRFWCSPRRWTCCGATTPTDGSPYPHPVTQPQAESPCTKP
jgi:hypothetical protein